MSLLQDSVHCALEVSRLQLEEWKSQGLRAQEEALIQKALLQEELVTVRARMCDVSLVCISQRPVTQKGTNNGQTADRGVTCTYTVH